MNIMVSPIIDLYFPVSGSEVPIDHGYAAFSAISRIFETPDDQWLHGREDVGIHLIRGRYLGRGRLALMPYSRFAIRAPADLTPKFLLLAGKQLHLAHDVLRLGIPQPRALTPASELYAHLVTTKNGQDESRFDSEVARQLGQLNIQGNPVRGQRRNFRVKGKTIIAHTLKITGLSDEDSIRLQESGIGGRRRLGCGIFIVAS